jgi:L-asparaginase II
MSHAEIAHVVRSSFVEGAHHGTVVALDASGATVVQAGEPAAPIFPRSANKPLQVVAMLRAGLELEPHLLALSTASHAGEGYHRDGVRRLLAVAGLGVEALQTPPDLPSGEEEADAWRRAGRVPSAVAHNCSGKHAAMLVTCVLNGWPTATYRAPDHPLQQAIRETVTDLCGEPIAATGVDGCGAPVLAISAIALARSFAKLATAAPGTPEHRVAQAIRTHPEWVGGTGLDLTRLVHGLPDVVAKDGAEGVFAAALPDGRACVVKIADGADRARAVVLAALLRRLGVEAPVLDELSDQPVRGGGTSVGRIEAVGF